MPILSSLHAFPVCLKENQTPFHGQLGLGFFRLMAFVTFCFLFPKVLPVTSLQTSPSTFYTEIQMDDCFISSGPSPNATFSKTPGQIFLSKIAPHPSHHTCSSSVITPNAYEVTWFTNLFPIYHAS